jgi:DNA ligase-1
MIEYEVCTGVSHLEKFYNSLIAQGAEGIMLRKPNSPYERKRSHNLLKLKPSYSDEAIVIGHETGEGRNKDRLGALVCTWQSITFNIGTGLTDSDRNNPPEIGSKVTFGFSSLTDAGIPRFPVFVAVRDYE